jgi:hypothetical protein
MDCVYSYDSRFCWVDLTENGSPSSAMISADASPSLSNVSGAGTDSSKREKSFIELGQRMHELGRFCNRADPTARMPAAELKVSQPAASSAVRSPPGNRASEVLSELTRTVPTNAEKRIIAWDFDARRWCLEVFSWSRATHSERCGPKRTALGKITHPLHAS